MQGSESLKKVRDIIQSFLKSKKVLRMYPPNNPIYNNALEDNFTKLKDYFIYHDNLDLKVRQNDILYDSEQVYFSNDKDDNLALFFFKDGLREISFGKGLTYEELEDFLRIISLDFNRDAVDDDIVTLFWEKDFRNIHYVVDDMVLADETDYEERAVEEVMEKGENEDNLLKAYEDAFKEKEEVKDVSIVPLSDKDLQALLIELEKDSRQKTEKLLDILFEMLFMCDNKSEYDDLSGFFMNAIEYAIGHGELSVVSGLLSRARHTADNRNYSDEIRRCASRIVYLAGTDTIINMLGEILDSGQELDEKILEELVRHFDRNAITPFMKILGELKTIHARKIVIDALVFLGTKDILTLSKGLNDSRWYVVRNIIYILRKIGDKRAVDYLLTTVKHGDIRVKKEVIRALGELGGASVLQTLRECLDDPDIQVRSASLKAFGNIGSESAKRIILDRLFEKNFKDRHFDEKKDYFEALSKWKDKDIFDYLVSTLRTKTFLGRAKNDENRACAAYSLGLLGNADALPVLNKYKNAGNKLLREFCFTAIKRLEGG